ncbi:dihydropteroate synthase [Sphingoaurantiacus capsulatus]|uniref:dihydropteroate synthase n=1 Tax=Sphingoaurantiacus capsulatus TaxID=1771310 RepID=A0ABV7XB62_9SPHN
MTDLYLRPTAFIDAPFGHDGQAARLAGGLCWFSAVELIARNGPRQLIPLDRLDDARATLPAPQRDRFDQLWSNLTTARPPLALGQRTLRFDSPSVMGILNVTPDSFSDGGRHMDADIAAAAAVDMAAAGVAIVDVGAESTRPGAAPVWEGDELARLEPLLPRLAAAGLLVSVDTRKAAVMRQALALGAGVVNDVSALTYDPAALDLVAAAGCPVVLMHHRGDPQTMQDDPRYDDVLLDVFDGLEARIAACVAAGIGRGRIIADPGIGFGKSLRHNLDLLNGLSLFHGLGVPLLLGASRKRFIGALSGEAPADQRLGGSIAVAVAGIAQGVQIVRVHDVPETVQALRVWRGLRDAALTP